MASASSPTAAYNTQNGIPAQGDYDPIVVDWVRQAAAATGADPVALLATSLQEAGAQRGRVGDAGTSYGPFQFHRGGALGAHTPQWANSYQAVLNRAHEFKRLGVRGGTGAAAVQRPRDPGLYAKGVDSQLARAASILGDSSSTQSEKKAAVAALTPDDPVDGDAADVGGVILQHFIDANAHVAKLPGSGSISSELPSGASLAQQMIKANADLAGVSAPFMPPAPAAPSSKPAAASSVPLKVTGPGAKTPAGVAAVNLAKQYLGVRYQWGGESPKGFDCSGLLQYVWAKRGVKIPRVTFDQIKAGRPVALNQLQPGDAVFFNHGRHVGMAIGGGQFIEAPHTGAVVRISSLAGRKDIVAARRYA